MSTTTSPTVSPTNKSKSNLNRFAWLRRTFIGIAVTILSLSGIGAVYQAIAAKNDQRSYPPPGRFVDIGGRRIHMVVAGNKTNHPTVILEGGMASFSSNFYWIQNELAATTRVVAYDRAGLGWSDPAPEPQDAQQSARDLHTALQAAGIRGPYVVAGHSYGGLVVRAFTDLYPDEVTGMVLIDASHPDQWVHIPASKNGTLNGRSNLITSVLARLGVVRLFELERGLYTGLPDRQAAEMKAVLAKPESWKTSGDVLLIWNERTRPQINQSKSLNNLPLVVLSVTEQALFADVLTNLQAELPDLSSNSLHYTIEGATHGSLVAQREHAMIVAEMIRKVMESASTGMRLSEISRQGDYDE